MTKLITLINDDIGLFAVADVELKYPYNIIQDVNRPVVDFYNEQMLELFEELIDEEIDNHELNTVEFSNRRFIELLFKVHDKIKKMGIRLYCIGESIFNSKFNSNIKGDFAEIITSLIYNYDGFRSVYYHKNSANEHGFDLVVRHEETGVLGIVEIKSYTKKGQLKTYLPFVKNLNCYEMSIPWIIYSCDLIYKENPTLVNDILNNIKNKSLERFVIVYLVENREIRFFINEHFYDQGIDNYLVNNQYRQKQKERIHYINDDIDPTVKAAYNLWQTGLPQTMKMEFDSIRKKLNIKLKQHE